MNAISEAPPQQQCQVCGEVFDRDVFFRKSPRKPGGHISPPEFSGVCIGCQIARATERKAAP